MAQIWLLLDFLVLVAGGQIVYPGQYEKTVVTSRAPVLSGQPANYSTLQTVSNSQQSVQTEQSNQESTPQSDIAHSETRFYSPTQLPFNASVSPTANSTASSLLGNWDNHVSYQFVICMFFTFVCSTMQTTCPKNKINCKFL